jgi:hypothetical protein
MKKMVRIDGDDIDALKNIIEIARTESCDGEADSVQDIINRYNEAPEWK